jgi:hypothetical protein
MQRHSSEIWKDRISDSQPCLHAGCAGYKESIMLSSWADFILRYINAQLQHNGNPAPVPRMHYFLSLKAGTVNRWQQQTRKSCAQALRSVITWTVMTSRPHALLYVITAPRYGGQLRIYLISSRGYLTRGGPPAWGLGVGLQRLTVKKAFYEMSQRPSDLDGFLG